MGSETLQDEQSAEALMKSLIGIFGLTPKPELLQLPEFTLSERREGKRFIYRSTLTHNASEDEITVHRYPTRRYREAFNLEHGTIAISRRGAPERASFRETQGGLNLAPLEGMPALDRIAFLVSDAQADIPPST